MGPVCGVPLVPGAGLVLQLDLAIELVAALARGMACWLAIGLSYGLVQTVHFVLRLDLAIELGAALDCRLAFWLAIGLSYGLVHRVSSVMVSGLKL